MRSREAAGSLVRLNAVDREVSEELSAIDDLELHVLLNCVGAANGDGGVGDAANQPLVADHPDERNRGSGVNDGGGLAAIKAIGMNYFLGLLQIRAELRRFPQQNFAADAQSHPTGC